MSKPGGPSKLGPSNLWHTIHGTRTICTCENPAVMREDDRVRCIWCGREVYEEGEEPCSPQ